MSQPQKEDPHAAAQQKAQDAKMLADTEESSTHTAAPRDTVLDTASKLNDMALYSTDSGDSGTLLSRDSYDINVVDPDLERTLFDCDLTLSEEALKTMAKYVSGRLGLTPPLPASVLGEMRNFGRAMSVRLFRAPQWSVWLKTSGQFPLRALAVEEGGMVEQATDTTVDPATAMLFDLGLEPVTFIGADGEEDIGFPETRIEPSEELLDLLRHINRLLDELPSL